MKRYWDITTKEWKPLWQKYFDHQKYIGPGDYYIHRLYDKEIKDLRQERWRNYNACINAAKRFAKEKLVEEILLEGT